MNKTLLYVAKEPDDGVISDLQSFKDYDTTVCACNPGYVDYYKLLGYNVITHHKFFTTVDMRFDVVIGNPPYTDTSSIVSATGGGKSAALDTKFYELSMQMSDRVSLIIRSKFFAKQSSKFRRSLFEQGGIVSIQYLPEDTFPSISLTETCVVTWDRNYVGPTKITYKGGEVRMIELDKNTTVKLTNPDYVAEVDNNIAYRHERGEYDLNELNPGECPMYKTMGGKNSSQPLIIYVSKEQHRSCANQHGVVMNDKFGGPSFGGVFVKEYDHSISGSSICLKTNSREESERLRDYLLSEQVQDLVRLNKISNVHSKELFKTIPDMV